MNIIKHISEHFHNSTRSEKKIAQYILSNPVAVQYMSISTLAEECGIADATISRYCQKLGFSGYSELKLELAKAGYQNEQSAEDSGAPKDQFTDICETLSKNNIEAIIHTLNMLDEESIKQAVDYIGHAKRVYCFGQGGSMVLAMEAWARFITVTPSFQCIQDSHMQAMTAALLTSEDVIIYFSYSGATRDILDVLKAAHERQAKIILVSHFAKSPASPFADVVLLCSSKETPLQTGSVAAKISQLYIIDVLFNFYCMKFADESKRNGEITAEVVANKSL